MDGKRQSQYPRKNWSSVILWNCEHPKNQQITPELVNSAEPLFLHRFKWLDDDDIGELPIDWNWLVGWNTEGDGHTPKLLHFTEGGPYFTNYKNSEYADLWKEEYKACIGKEFTDADLLD